MGWGGLGERRLRILALACCLGSVLFIHESTQMTPPLGQDITHESVRKGSSYQWTSVGIDVNSQISMDISRYHWISVDIH